MSRSTPYAKTAVVDACRIHQRPDGTFPRKALQAVADAYKHPISTVRRWLSEAGLEPSADAETIYDVVAESLAEHIEAEGFNPGHAILATLAATAGNMKSAHRLAKTVLGYDKGYRSFVRDIGKQDPALVASARGGFAAMTSKWIYMKNFIPHRNHTWYLDHTQADIEVLPDHGCQKFRPWVSVLVDGCTGMWLAAIVWPEHVNAERVAMAIARAAAGDSVDSGPPRVGGLPTNIVFDNAAEHLSDAVLEGCVRLGIAVSPITPYRSWENGKVETAHGHLAEGLLSMLPGYTKGGTNEKKKPRLIREQPVAKDGRPNLLTMTSLQALVEEYRLERNRTVLDRHGRTPQERWDDDQTPLYFMKHEVVLANMAKSDRLHVVNKAGIRFRNRDYVAACLAPHVKQKVQVRHMPTVTEWIETFTPEGTYIGRAYQAETLSPEEREKIILHRARTQKAARRVEALGLLHRDHLAQAIADKHAPEDLPPALPMSAILEADPPPAPQLPPVRARHRREKDHDAAWDSLVDNQSLDDFEIDPTGVSHD